ncbi:MAG: Holliday junction resolvase RecU [Erysipelotrichaceae bacterium]|nr:Holliday junction resolvase RecU [Erysipelotrichaceae bacterium]MDY6034001.1 Holliday junction resolvase RecU [Bulleidia sp.]
MVNYPNGKKKTYVTQRTSAGGRGMNLEKDINTTNMFYLSIDKAVIHKKPTPVTIVSVDYPARSAAKITEAYFKLPSTTDYNGIYRAKYIDFEAKECASHTSFPLKSIHEHQIKHLQDVIRHGAIAFLIVKWTVFDETYFVKAEDIITFMKENERHSIPYTWFQTTGHLIPSTYVTPIDYLKIIDQLYFTLGGNHDKSK